MNDTTTEPNTPISSASTGPRTEEGKSISARNATKHGFYASRDYILPGEEDEFAADHTALMIELAPEGVLEQVFADEIMTASWRLRRCRIVEAGFADAPQPDEDVQRSVDRARARSHNVIRRSTAELRRLQTERAIRVQLGTTGETRGLADTRQIHLALNGAPLDDNAGDADAATPEPAAQRQKRITLSDLESLMAQADKQLCAQVRAGNPGSFRNPSPNVPVQTSSTPRNAKCPCGSGVKYKKCCGNPANERPSIAA